MIFKIKTGIKLPSSLLDLKYIENIINIILKN